MVERLTREETRAFVGPANDLMVAEILDMGATRSELAAARAWLENDEAMLNEGRPIPTGRVARLIDILRTYDETEVPSLRL